MRISAITAKNIMPIRYFEVDSLSNVVVLAGPNGVGKTRLVQRLLEHLQSPSPNAELELKIEATSSEERETWGQEMLTTQLVDDVSKFNTTLQMGRRRRNWRSSILNFESDRSIQQLKPYLASIGRCQSGFSGFLSLRELGTPRCARE